MNHLFNEFTNQFSVDKTLRFALKPIGKTEQNIKEKGLLEKDEERAKKYKKAKKIIDEYHKDFIDRRLKDFAFPKEDLEEFAERYKELKNNKNNKKLQDNLAAQQKKLRKAVASAFKDKRLFKKEFIKEDLPNWLKDHQITVDDVEDVQAIIKDFSKWTSYFAGFNENRKNIYTDEAHSTSIAYRLIHENLPKFLDNIDRYEDAKKLKVDFSDVEKNFDIQLENYFTPTDFNNFLTQESIDQYNKIRGGHSQAIDEKQQGINEKINLHAQQLDAEINTAVDEQKKGLKQTKKKIRSCQLEELYKQILSDRSKLSFRLEDITDDAALCKQITSIFKIDEDKNLIVRCERTDKITTEDFNITENLTICLDALDNDDSEKLYIKNDRAITDISMYLFREWGLITRCLEYYVEKAIKIKEQRKRWLKQSYFSFADIHNALESYFEEQYPNDQLDDNKQSEHGNNPLSIEEQRKIAMQKPLFDYFRKLTIRKKIEENNEFEHKKLLDEIQTAYKDTHPILIEYKNIKDEQLKKAKGKVQKIKNYLDTLMGLQHFLKPLSVEFKNKDKENKVEIFGKDNSFYSEFNPLFRVIKQIIPLYNQTRNYLTKKPYSMEKYKLNFENETLADGWDKNKETDNSCVILLKDGQYYLAVMDKSNKKLFKGKLPKSGNCFQKMEYKLLPGANKMLPKVFFSKRNIEFYAPSEEILNIRNVSSHTKNGAPKAGFQKKEFDTSDMRKMIDFLKISIAKHPDWRNFDFQFSPTTSYEDISGFYREVEHQGYKITFQDISEDYINQCIEEGKLYFFQIYSKDFSPKTRGKPNLQTLYWRALFDEKNLQDIVYKLNGKAELFHRKPSIEYSSEIWNKGHHANDPNKKQRYPIIKDHRYAKDTYLFHASITCNFKANGIARFNDKVNHCLKNNPQMNIIGIDRGERHLAYYTVINQQGKILQDKNGRYLQGSLNKPFENDLNIPDHVKDKDYHELLDKREKERDDARKSWGTIEKIKDLKAGYLSQVVHKIATLMVEHNAIVVFEDLNFGFKKGRIRIEKQVYQKLEKMLIDKLNYLVFKDRDTNDLCGTLNALQLTAPFQSFQKLGKQTGFIFYVPAYHTSKICPATGFVNLLYPKYETINKSQDFFGKFDKIAFNKDEEYFEFHFKYKNFTDKAEGSKQNWIVCSHGIRLENFRNKEKKNQWDTQDVPLVTEIKKLLEDSDIDFEHGECIKNKIIQQNSQFFKSLVRLLRLTLQIRNSKTRSDEDWLISPVKDIKGNFFDSRETDYSMPKNADANGAYHTALKGLLMLEQLKEAEDVTTFKADLSNKAWYRFAQKK